MVIFKDYFWTISFMTKSISDLLLEHVIKTDPEPPNRVTSGHTIWVNGTMGIIKLTKKFLKTPNTNLAKRQGIGFIQNLNENINECVKT